MVMKIQPPGLDRPIPEHTKSGKISFEYAKNDMKAETAYWIWGDLSNTSKTPLICLHGGPGIPHTYILAFALIWSEYGIPVIMYDQVGCGESTRYKDKKLDEKFWTPELFMSELDNLKSHLSIKEFDLIGQSWGGMLAGQYAIEKQPKGLRKLIIADSPTDMGLWLESCNKLRKQLPKSVQDVLDRCERDGNISSPEYEEAVMSFYKLHMCRLETWPEGVNRSFEYLAEDNTVYLTMCGPSEFFLTGNLKTWSIRDSVHKITEKTVPGGLLLINGYYDEAQDETTVDFFTRPSCKTKWIRYPLSSHFPFWEEGERFLADVGGFLMM